ncbi:uncharacterized protein LOC134845318 isoform X2 [Symsagittifera roscoffensis]
MSLSDFGEHSVVQSSMPQIKTFQRMTFFYVLPFSDVQQTNSAAGFDPIRTNEHDCSGSGLLNLSIGHCHSLMASPWKQPESDIPEEGFGFGLEGGDGDPVIVKSVLSDIFLRLALH